MRNFIFLSAVFLALLSASAASTVTRREVEENFISRTNEWKLAERRWALFILDLNDAEGGQWRGFELKASTNNFTAATEGMRMVFWSISDEADKYLPGSAVHRSPDGMRLYITHRDPSDPDPLLSRWNDNRPWRRYGSTVETIGLCPQRIAVIVGRDNCSNGGAWLSSDNEELVWSWMRFGGGGPETDADDHYAWRPVQPVRWYLDLPEWAKQGREPENERNN